MEPPTVLDLFGVLECACVAKTMEEFHNAEAPSEDFRWVFQCTPFRRVTPVGEAVGCWCRYDFLFQLQHMASGTSQETPKFWGCEREAPEVPVPLRVPRRKLAPGCVMNLLPQSVTAFACKKGYGVEAVTVVPTGGVACEGWYGTDWDNVQVVNDDGTISFYKVQDGDWLILTPDGTDGYTVTGDACGGQPIAGICASCPP